MADKDFLNNLIEEKDKPESFKEENRVKIEKEKFVFKKIYLLYIFIPLIVVFCLGYFFLFRATITMQDFVNKPKSELFTFLRQEEIKTNVVALKEEYSLEVKKDHVISQSISAGQKIKKNTKLNFVISLGADPNQIIKLPDFNQLSKDQAKKWIEDNRADNARINVVSSDEVEADKLIKVEVKDKDNYLRKESLTLVYSKGKAEAKEVRVPDFKNELIDSYETKLKNLKLVVNKVERYLNDDKKAEGTIISVSPEVGKTLKEGETITVVYSKGKAVTVVDLLSMSKNDAQNWLKENALYVNEKQKYSDSYNYVLSQSLKAGSQLGKNDKLEVVVNKGQPRFDKIIGTMYSDLLAKVDEIRQDGYDLSAGEWISERIYVKGSPKGSIVGVKCNHENGDELNCSNPLPNHSRIGVVVSLGNIHTINLVANVAPETEKNPVQPDPNSKENKVATQSLSALSIASQLTSVGIVYSSKDPDLNKATKMIIESPLKDKSEVIDLTSETRLSLEIYEGSIVRFE